MGAFFQRRKGFLFVFLVSAVLSFVLFGNVIKGKFVGDDNSVINERADLRSLKSIPSFFVSPAYPDRASIGLYRPLTLASYALNFAFSERPAGFHILNIILHALNVVLVFLIAGRFASKKVAYISSLLFLFLPIHTEAVSSIVGRSELLSIFFILSAFLLFLKNRHIWASFFFFCALLSKEFSVVFLPLIGLLLLIEAVEAKRLRKFVRIGLHYLPPLVIYFSLRYITLGKYAFGGLVLDPVTAPLTLLGFKERILTSFLSLFLYLKKTFYPIGLSPDYSFNQIPAVQNVFSSPQAIVGLILLLGFISMIVFGRKKLKIAASILLVPFIFISNMFFVTSGSFAERWWYLPSFGLVVIVAIFVEWLVGKYRRLETPIFVLLLTLMVWFSWIIVKQNKIWLDNKSLFVYAAEVSPGSAWARSNLAAVYLAEKNFEKAKQEVKASLEIYPDNAPPLNILGKLYWAEKDFRSAEEAFKKALEIDLGKYGRNVRGLNRALACLNLDFGDNKSALAYMEKAIQYPAFGNKETAEKFDELLLQTIKGKINRNPRSYTREEAEEIAGLIRVVRGF